MLAAAAVGATGIVLGGRGVPSASRGVTPGRGGDARLTAAAIRQPGSLPNPAAAPGTEHLPEIKNIVVVMMENHSFDNMLGMSGRGDGFPLGHDGSCPRPPARTARAGSSMPSTCRATA